jgi:hypothetical protein
MPVMRDSDNVLSNCPGKGFSSTKLPSAGCVASAGSMLRAVPSDFRLGVVSQPHGGVDVAALLPTRTSL